MQSLQLPSGEGEKCKHLVNSSRSLQFSWGYSTCSQKKPALCDEGQGSYWLKALGEGELFVAWVGGKNFWRGDALDWVG